MGPGSALASPRLSGTTLNLLLASTVKHLRHDSGGDVKKHPRGTNARVMHQHRPSKFRGHREDRAPLAPMGPVQQKSTGVGPQVQPDTRPFPAQWFTAYGALSPGCRRTPGLIASVAGGSSSANLIAASGDQDHTPLPSAFARFVGARQHVHRILPPTSVTIAIRPLWSRTRKLRPLICPTAQAKIFVASEVKQLNSFESAAENRRTTRAIFGAFCKHARRSGAALTHWFRHPPSNWCR
jgi:hypothetical protein